jgi:hypothetical protein
MIFRNPHQEFFEKRRRGISAEATDVTLSNSLASTGS